MRVVFLGSASLAAVALESLAARYRPSGRWQDVEVVAVVTQPDRPKGRHLKVSACPAKTVAQEAGVAVLTPVNVNTPESVAAVQSFRPDLMVVVAYGQILKPALLAVPAAGAVNVHASLLPKLRGAAPVQWAIVRGERVTGVTTMYLNERMDAGDIIFQQAVAVEREDTGGALHDRLAREGAALLIRTIEAVCEGRAPRQPQDETQATYAPKLKKEDGRIDWTMSSEDIYNQVRGFNPWPCCFCELRGRAPAAGRETGDPAEHERSGSAGRLKVLRVNIERAQADSGRIVDISGDGPLVATRDGGVRLVAVQPEGKREMSGGEYVRGHALKVGDLLG